MSFAEAFAQQEMQTWYNEPHRWLYARVLQRIGNGSDAADVAQDTVLSVITIEDR